MPSVSLTWHTMHDDRVCPICKALDGKTWEFTPESGVPTTITHEGRVVWTETEGSAAHGHKGNCRCHLTSQTHIHDLLVAAKKLRDEVVAVYGSKTP